MAAAGRRTRQRLVEPSASAGAAKCGRYALAFLLVQNIRDRCAFPNLSSCSLPARLFIKRVDEAIGLSQGDREALRGLQVVERVLTNREAICQEGDAASHCTVLLDGFLVRSKIVGDREQILAVHVPGDFPDLQTLHLPVLDHDIVSVGPSRVGVIPHAHLKAILTASPTLTHVFWRETLVEAAIFREWVCNVGARSALASVAHLICELAARLDAVGLLQDHSFQLPLVQQDIANARGISAVHVNRTLQELRKRKLISWEGRSVTLLDRKELGKLAGFSGEYLHQRARPAAA
ncbi:MAG: Crp/Fnr family transcriptional regulator [Bradyrhizobium sp.]|nr:Crp/Fnr family transcriptional regulator [Bradyrhizobium sp.]